jgi:hypothetical protein
MHDLVELAGESRMVELPTVVPRMEDRNWSKLTLGERIRQIEVEGYVLIPDLLTADQIARIKAQVATLETMGMDYSERQRTASEVMFLAVRLPSSRLIPRRSSFSESCWETTSSAPVPTMRARSPAIQVWPSIRMPEAAERPT